MTSARVLAELGERIAEDGPAAHHRLLQDLSTLIVRTAPGTAAALADRNAPEIVRQRAVAVASAVLLREPTASAHGCGVPTSLGTTQASSASPSNHPRPRASAGASFGWLSGVP